jgi:hypothetical protein
MGADERQHDRELQEGLERVICEMAERGWDNDRIARAVEDACAYNEVEL